MDLEALKAAKAEAYQRYAEAAEQLHDAYWVRLQERLAEIRQAIMERYPGAVVEAERTQWTSSDEFMFDHWLDVRLSESDCASPGVYEWLADALPSLEGVAFRLRRLP